MSLVSCRRQEIVSQGSALDLKCKFNKCNMSSFLALSHSLDCFICAKDIMIIVLLLQMMGGCEGFAVFCLCYGLGGGAVGDIIFLIFFVLFLSCC